MAGHPRSLNIGCSLGYADIVSITLRTKRQRFFRSETTANKTVLIMRDGMERETAWIIEPIYTMKTSAIAQSIITAHTIYHTQSSAGIVTSDWADAQYAMPKPNAALEWETFDSNDVLRQVQAATIPANWTVIAAQPRQLLPMAIGLLFFALTFATVTIITVATSGGYFNAGCLGMWTLLCFTLDGVLWRSYRRSRHEVLVIVPLGFIAGNRDTGEVWQSIRFADIVRIEFKQWSGGVAPFIHYQLNALPKWQIDVRFGPREETAGKIIAAFTRYQHYHQSHGLK